MNRPSWDAVSDDELWQLAHQHWPSREVAVDPDDLADYVDGTASAEEAERTATRIAGNPASLEDYAMLLELQSTDTATDSRASLHEAALATDTKSPTSRLGGVETRGTRSRSPWTFTILSVAASLLAIACGVAFTRNRGMQTQLASLSSELTRRKFNELQIAMDTSRVEAAEGLWLGNPSAWYGSSTSRTRGGGDEAVATAVKSDAETLLNDLGASESFSVDQLVLLAELQAAAGKLVQSEATLNAVPQQQRDARWRFAQASLFIVQSKQSPPGDATATAKSAAATKTLLELQDEPAVNSQALFNLASLRLFEGEQLVDSDFEAALSLLDDSIRYWDFLLQTDLPTTLKRIAEQQRTRAEALKIP